MYLFSGSFVFHCFKKSASVRHTWRICLSQSVTRSHTSRSLFIPGGLCWVKLAEVEREGFRLGKLNHICLMRQPRIYLVRLAWNYPSGENRDLTR